MRVLHRAMAAATRPIHETVMKLTDQRGARRFFARARYLERAGFLIGTALAFQQADGQVIISRSDVETTKHVHESKGVATIDLNERWLSALFGSAERVHVRVETNRIIVSVHALDQAIAGRPRDGSFGSLFTGAALMDEAARQAGLRPVWGVEWDATVAETAMVNHPDATMYLMSVHEAVYCDLAPVDTLAVSLPCTPFSRVRTTNADGTKRDYSAAAADHALGDLAFAAYSVILRVNPRTVVVECVPGLLQDSVGVALMGALRRIGYVVDSRTLNAAEHGGLTKRTRAVIIAQTPEADGRVRCPWPEVVPAAQSIADVLEPDVPDSAWVDPTTHPHIFARSDANAAKGRGFQLRPTSATATATGTFTRESWEGVRVDSPLLAHPTRPDTFRRFTITEAKRIMGLRDSYVLPEATTRAGALLGQAVHVGLFTQVFARTSGRVAEAWSTPADVPPTGVAASQLALFDVA